VGSGGNGQAVMTATVGSLFQSIPASANGISGTTYAIP
jgi:hypothetical protein